MPCHTMYSGSKSATKASSLTRTKLSVDMTMHDENGNIHGYIKSQDSGTLKAIVLDKDGVTELMSKEFFLSEFSGDEALCKKNDWVEVKGDSKKIIQVAEEWLTEQYQTYVHSHETPQDVYEIGTNYLV